MSNQRMGYESGGCSSNLRDFQMEEQCTSAAKPAMDGAINQIHDEVMRYWSSLQGLIVRLESPRPQSCGSGGDKVTPATIGEALRDIHNILVGCNDILQETNKRIDEQVGELKLLP